MKVAIVVAAVAAVGLLGWYVFKDQSPAIESSNAGANNFRTGGQNPDQTPTAVFGFLTELARTSGSVVNLVNQDRARAAANRT